MNAFSIVLGLALAAAASSPASAQCQSQTTLFAGGNSGSAGGIIYYDINVTNAGGINVASIDFNSTAAAGTALTMNVYTVPNTYVGNTANAGAWTLVSSGAATAAGNLQPTACDLSDFSLPAGAHGIGLVIGGGSHSYTNGNGTNQ